MALDSESFNKDLYDLLKVRGYKPVPLDAQNQRVPASQAADVIQFTFVKDGKDYGKAWVTIDDAQNVIVYYDDEQQDSPNTTTPGVEYDDTWTGFLKHVKQWAQRRQLSFELSNKDRLGDDMRQRDYFKMKEKVSEGKQLNELSPETMKSYRDKASSDRTAEIRKTLDKTNPSTVRDAAMARQGKRARGIFGADKKLGRFKDPDWGKGDDNEWIKRDAQAGLSEARTDHFGYEIKGNAKPWGLYHTRPNKPEKLISKHHNKNSADAAKWDQLGMGSCATGEKFTVKKIPMKSDAVQESYHPMGKKASYNDAVPNVKIVLQHNRALEEGEQRYRNVAKIYLENVDGERFLAPTTRPGLARVYARHIAEGGLPNDDRWNHIKNVCEDYNKMAGFVRATRGKQFNESAQPLIEQGIAHYDSLRETLSKLTGHRGYNAYFESWSPPLMEDDSDESINELFVQETMDPRIESVMPILSRLHKHVAEMTEVGVLEGWADSLINEKLELGEAPSYPWLDHEDRPANKREKARDSEEALRKEVAKKQSAKKDEDLEEGALDTIRKGMKSLKRGMKGWEKGMHDVDSVKSATKSLSPDSKEAALKAKVGKGSPAELQQKLINREKNKQVDEVLDTRDAKMSYAQKNMDSHGAAFNKYVQSNDPAEKADAHKTAMKRVRGLDTFVKNKVSKDEMDEAKKPTKKPTFVVIKDYAEWNDRYVLGSGCEPDETDVDGKFIGVAVSDDGVRGVWYRKAGFGTFCSVPFADVVDYVERDPNWPYDNDHRDDFHEDLGPEQKKVGQLGPTEKVKNNNIGKLVGASESREMDDELARITEMAGIKYTQNK